MLILAWLLHQHCRELMCLHVACMPHCREELNIQTMDAGKEENGNMGFTHELIGGVHGTSWVQAQHHWIEK